MNMENELKRVLLRKIRLAKEIHIEFKKMREHTKKLRKIKGYREKHKINKEAIRKRRNVKKF